MQQITRGDYLKDLITIFVENNLQTELTDLYSEFIFQCGEIQKVLTPAPVIKISFDEIESQLLKSTNTCYLAGITTDGHKHTFNGSMSFNTRGEVVYYEPPVSTVTPAATETNCDCQGLRGFYSNCSQPAIKAYFTLNYVPTKLSELQNDTDFQDSVDVAESISIHNDSTEAHPYIQGLISDETSTRASQTEALEVSIAQEVSVRAGQTEALSGSIQAEATAREEAVSFAISTTEAYTDTHIAAATTAINTTIGDLSDLDTSVKSSVVNAINSEVTARENADNNLQGQIDGLAAASDVTDIVGTYQELQNYDTQHLQDNDIIKVLSDSTHDDQPSYYRFDKDTDTFSYIGSESASYTKAQSDSIFVTQTTEINGHALSSDINLTPSDIGALADTYATVISANTSAIASNTSIIAQHTTAIAGNTSDISTINGKIPTDASSSNKLVSASTLAASIANFANQDLSNLTSNGEARLHALKAYADEGELLTDADGLAFVKKYAHSTFDLSKFTVVGSPTITNDGIASGFSNSNYLQKTLSLTYTHTCKIIFPFTTSANLTTVQRVYYFGAPNKALSIALNTSNKFTFTWEDINGNTVALINPSDYTLTTNTSYLLKLEDDGTNIILSIKKTSDSSWTQLSTEVKQSNLLLTETLTFGRSLAASVNQPFLGSIDLKQFSITVDGVPVFSGNKTGVDAIKPDDYTVVGTPTISADGIANFPANSQLYKELNINAANDIVIDGEVFLREESNTILSVRDTSTSAVEIGISFAGGSYSTPYSVILYYPQNASTRPFLTTTANVWSPNKTYYYKLVINNYQLNMYFGTDKNNLSPLFSTISIYNQATFNRLTINGFYNNVPSSDRLYEFNLNSLHVYSNGDLVYQPCLKIPYTESKTGSKIVDSVYRDRVNDMADQFGYANYYTLSDTDFTLPQVELYGLIGQKTLRDSYENGINKWYLYSNRDLEQQGSCTSGVEVTLAKPFADTNYVLSVPYSAKSTTAFTPTQTGDWIAKGKGIL